MLTEKRLGAFFTLKEHLIEAQGRAWHALGEQLNFSRLTTFSGLAPKYAGAGVARVALSAEAFANN